MSILGSTAMRLDEEQAMLLDFARSFCSEKGGSEAVRERLEEPDDFTPELWEEMVAMGWTGLGLPERVGGSGLGIGAAVPVLESMGRNLLGSPLMSTLLAGQLLLRAGGESQDALLSRLATGTKLTAATLEEGDWGGPIATRLDGDRLTGCKELVADGASAEYFVVSARQQGELVLAVVDRSSLTEDAVEPRSVIDLTHRAADVHFEDTPVETVLAGEDIARALAEYELLGALLVAAESTGAAAACLDLTVEYLKTRKQFGKLIGSYQSLKHPAVELLSAVDNSRSFIYHAATLVEEGPLSRDAEIACRMAKAQATETLKVAGDRAVQFHGGMGFSWDCDAQLYIRRAQWAQQQFGDAQRHRQLLAELLLGPTGAG